MIKIRLARQGRKKYPVYTIVAADIRSPRDGRFIEKLGQYNPNISEGDVLRNIKKERIQHWVDNGAVLTDTVASLFRKYKVFAS